MLVITDIKVANVDRDSVMIAKYRNLPSFAEVLNAETEGRVEITEEMVRGRVFRNVRGEEVCIGMSTLVQEALGMPADCFDLMQRELDTQSRTIAELRGKNAMYQRRINDFNGLGFFAKVMLILTSKCRV